jgi:hypothetical protein
MDWGEICISFKGDRCRIMPLCKDHFVSMSDGSECPACKAKREDPVGLKRRVDELLKLRDEAYHCYDGK